jgi:surface antigen
MPRTFLLLSSLLLASCTQSTGVGGSAAVPGQIGLPALSERAQALRFATWQQAMERNVSGQTASWTDSSQLRGSIAPIETVNSTTEGWCRDYEEVIAAADKRYRVVGIACRKPGPRWLVLDVRAFNEAGLVP